MSESKFDGIIFDMDGTLWDAVDSYARIWNVSLEQCGIDHAPVTRGQLLSLMGKTLDRIIEILVPEAAGNTRFYNSLDENERRLMPVLGGRLYDGVKETLAVLAECHLLFMVSNCSANGLPDFLRYTGLEPYITDTLSHGDNQRDKAYNIGLIAERYLLARPLYVGDTNGDFEACRKAGVPFAWASYGFGHVTDPDITLTRFSDLLKYT